MAKAPGEDKCAMTLKMPVGLSVMEDGKPFFFEGGKTGCLLIHGFTGTTSSMRPMGEFLAAKGVTVLGPRLPGHGTDVNDMGKWAYTDWISMGGLLTLYLAEKHSDSLAGIMPISSPVRWLAPGANGVALKFVGVLKHVLKTFPGPGNDLKDPDVVEVAYEKLSTNAAHELVKLAGVVDADLARITCPVRLFAAREDHVVPPRNSQYIYDNVSSSDKEIIWLDNCYHVATLDYDKEKIFESSYNFMTQVG
jgi:carboxylesterase